MSYAKTRLQALEAELRAKGVVDVKFHFDRRQRASLSSVAAEIAEVVEAMLQGRHTRFTGCGDSVMAPR